MSHFGVRYYVQVAILTLPVNSRNPPSVFISCGTTLRCLSNAARIIQKNWREYYLLNKVKPYMHRFKLDHCPLTRKKLLSDMDKVRLEISASRQFKPALHAKLNRLIRMYLAEDYDRFMTKRQKLWSEVKLVLNQELIARSNGENWVPVTPINLTENQKKWCHRAHCYNGFYFSSVYLAESNAEIDRLKALAKKRNDAACVIQRMWLSRYKPEEELEELDRQQMKLDGWVDDMCNPYNC